VDDPGHQFFPRTGFAADHDIRIRPRCPRRQLDDRLNPWALADNPTPVNRLLTLDQSTVFAV